MSAIFSVTRDEVIKAAMQECQALARGQSPQAGDITDCALRLGAMLKFWNTNGFQAWCYQTLSFPSVANQLSYTIGESGANVTNVRPLRVTQVWTKDSNDLVQPLVINTRQQFNMQSPSNAPGPATSAYYDPQLGRGVFYPWPIPTDTTRTFYLNIQRPINDITTGGGTFDIPQEGYLALVYGLAELIMGIYGTETNEQKRIEKMAARYLVVFSDFADEDGSVFFQPNSQGR